MNERKCSACQSELIRNILVAGHARFRCLECGLFFLENDTDKQNYLNLVKAHYEEIDPHDKVVLSRKRIYERFLDEAFLEHQGGKSLLDVGCGSGYFLSVAQKKGWKVKGVEISEGLACKGKACYSVEIFSGDFNAIDFKGEKFDVITLWNVFDQLPNPLETLLKIKATLKDDGLLYLRLPSISFHYGLYRIHQFFKEIHLEPFLLGGSFVFHLFGFSPKAIQVLFERNGFRNINIRNAVPTEGDPYKGRKALGFLKKTIYIVAQIIYFISFKKACIAPSIEVYAQK